MLNAPAWPFAAAQKRRAEESDAQYHAKRSRQPQPSGDAGWSAVSHVHHANPMAVQLGQLQPPLQQQWQPPPQPQWQQHGTPQQQHGPPQQQQQQQPLSQGNVLGPMADMFMQLDPQLCPPVPPQQAMMGSIRACPPCFTHRFCRAGVTCLVDGVDGAAMQMG